MKCFPQTFFATNYMYLRNLISLLLMIFEVSIFIFKTHTDGWTENYSHYVKYVWPNPRNSFTKGERRIQGHPEWTIYLQKLDTISSVAFTWLTVKLAHRPPPWTLLNRHTLLNRVCKKPSIIIQEVVSHYNLSNNTSYNTYPKNLSFCVVYILFFKW